MLRSFIEDLRQQHKVDLLVYRALHQNVYNRMLHGVLIPVETAAVLLFVAGLVSLSRRCAHLPLIQSVAVTLGLVSLVIADGQHRLASVASFLFHVWLGLWIGRQTILGKPPTVKTNLTRAVVAGILAPSLQVAVGHWWLEQNQPNVATNLQEVSWLALTQSVLIAWSS